MSKGETAYFPIHLLTEYDLTQNEFKVLIWLLSYSNRSFKPVCLTIDELLTGTGLARSQYFKTQKKLMEKKIIDKDGNTFLFVFQHQQKTETRKPSSKLKLVKTEENQGGAA